MLEISFMQLLVIITILWVFVRGFAALRKKGIDWKRECLLLTVYICIVVVSRIVYFPWHLVDGHIGILRFDAEKILPFWINFRPLTFLNERYHGWALNTYGNIAMFIPVGIFWGLCFKRLDNIFKVTLAGFGFSFLIEVSQLLFYERSSDIDDLILNTTGAFIGALIYFSAVALIKRSKKNTVKV